MSIVAIVRNKLLIKNHKKPNMDIDTITGFGDEWQRFTQASLSATEKEKIFHDYFHLFPWDLLPDHGGVGLDVGCGSGRWATIVAPRVGMLHCIDASAMALEVARINLMAFRNVQMHHASVDDMPIPDESLDFAYSLGVLHHVPDTMAAVRSISRKLKPGAPFLIYLYYAFDGRPFWFRWIWRMSDVVRHCISRLPKFLKYIFSQIIAICIYWPLSRIGEILDKVGYLPGSWPLSYYRNKSFYVMRTDALDRFGTKLEKRFTRSEIEAILCSAGFTSIKFSELPPYWCAVGIKT